MLSVINPTHPVNLTGAPTGTWPGSGTGAVSVQVHQPQSCQSDNNNFTQEKCSQLNTPFIIHDHSRTLCKIDNVLVDSFKNLLKMYSMHVNIGQEFPGISGDGGQAAPLIIAGGLQQYLIKNIKSQKESIRQPQKGSGSEHTTFHDFPDSIQLEIFSHLDVQDLCIAAMVCRHWYCVASDNIFWQQKLDCDVKTWDVISHTTTPQMYKDCKSDWTNKEIYLRCSPTVNKLMRQSNRNFHNLSKMLRTIWPKKTPRVAMFGPGLESGTSQIVREMLEDTHGIFQTIGMFPGQFEGMGSGFKIKMGSVYFDLLTLYTSSRQERESRSQDQRLQHSRLLNPQNKAANARPRGEEAVVDEEEKYEVRKAVKDLCQTLDAFIFVLDSSQDEEIVRRARLELHAMVNDDWVKSTIPVAIMSCTPGADTTRISCYHVINHLQLNTMKRPWQVRDCVTQTMDGVMDSIKWLVEQAQHT